MLVKAFRHMGFECSKADPCLFYKWTTKGLVLWITWVDDCLVCGHKESALEANGQLMDRFDCSEVGELKEYIGCKVERTENYIHQTQPVLMQSFVDEFDLLEGNAPPTPAAPGKILRATDENGWMDARMQSVFRSGMGKLLHMLKWSRPDVLNSVRYLSRYIKGATAAHL